MKKTYYVDWVSIGLLITIVVLLFMVMSGCKHCEPQVITVPQIVEKPVPIPPEPLIVPDPPQLETCTQDTVKERIRCVGRNVEALRLYSQRLLDEIESHNAAIDQ